MVGFVAYIAKPEGLHIEIDVFIKVQVQVLFVTYTTIQSVYNQQWNVRKPLLSFILQTHTVLSHEVIMLYIRGVDVLHQ